MNRGKQVGLTDIPLSSIVVLFLFLFIISMFYLNSVRIFHWKLMKLVLCFFYLIFFSLSSSSLEPTSARKTPNT